MKIYRRGKKGLFTVELWHRGKRIVQATGTPNKAKAEAFARHLVASLEAGRYLPRQERVTWDELADDLETYYRVQDRRSRDTLRWPLAHLKAAFGGRRALDITSSRLIAYTASRREAGASKSTVNRELATLSRAFTLAVNENGKLTQGPRIHRLDDSDNVRMGFVSIADYNAIRAAALEWLAALTDFLYWTGVRLNEACTLEWRDVDFDAGVIRIRAERVKTNEQHEIPLVARVQQIIAEAWERRRLDCRYVFHRNGWPVSSNTAGISWRRVAARAGYTGIRLHDLRRSFVRNMRQLGMAESVIMKFTGHRTRRIFERYNIVDNAEKVAAILKLSEWASQQPTRSGIVAGRFPKQAVNSGLEMSKDKEITDEGGSEMRRPLNGSLSKRKP
jgi:integrase